MSIFVRPKRNSWKSIFRPDWPISEIFKLGPRAQFLANRPNSFFVDHIDTRSLGGIHHWASRGTAGRELRSGQILPPPALNKLDQRPLYIGLRWNFQLVSIGEFSQRGRAIVRPSQTQKFVRMYLRALHFGSLRGEISISVCKWCIKRIQIFISDFSACCSPETWS